jgi:hypothetical protein
MPVNPTGGYQVACETCGATAPAAFDEPTALSNATAAGYIVFTVRPDTPRAGQAIYECPICLSAAAQAVAAAQGGGG